MKLSFRSGIVVLWLAAGILLVAGVHATRAPGLAAQEPAPAAPDTAMSRLPGGGATDSATVQPSGPPASGGGAARPSLETEPEAGAPSVQTARSVRRIAEIETPIHQRLVSVVGMLALLGIAWLLSVNRGAIPWRLVVWGVGLQVVFALIILKSPPGEAFFLAVNRVIVSLLGFTEA
ncbi:MAG TPA: Na+ dependent nucleoside transporter N-terminal domain-containing protein, partial [Longimicrobiales bacterium]|nr:Na+ dependent nucleoside transporter N-terminal domain-containing protein [Longimicrobiales bacterium]